MSERRMSRIIYRNAFCVVMATFIAAAIPGCGKNSVAIPDPCALVTIDEIRRVAPDAASAIVAETPVEGGTIKTCVWKNGAGVDQIRLVSKAADNSSPVEAALKAIMRNQPAVRVAAVPSVGPDAAAAFSGSGDGEIMTILVAQNDKVFLDLRPQASGIRGEKSPGFAAIAALMKTALDRSKK